MKGHVLRRLCLLAIPLAMSVGAIACTDETIVYRDRPVYDDPPSGAGDFVGYTLTGADPGGEMPSCGNCHVGPSAEWEATRHADAWATLQGSGHAQEFCAGCHTVNELGNVATDPGGYSGSQDSTRYKDVQCESCHGPGLPHVALPDGSGPLASLVVATDATNGCGECHQGTHHPFVEQWENSAHGSVSSFAADREYCNGCHSGNGALDRWGINAKYIEKVDMVPGSGNYLNITCGVCHDPHGSENTGQLRFPVDTNDLDRHLCSNCHNRRSSPDPTSQSLSPHSPEKAMLIGEAGFFFPGMAIDPGEIIGTHGSEGNPTVCAQCHVASWTVTNAETGDFEFQNVGHTFNAIPCLEDGIDNGDSECDLTLEDRYFGGCAEGACHGGSETSAIGLLRAAADGLRFLAGEVDDLLARVPAGEIGKPNEITTAEGALFNYNLARFGAGRDGADITELLEYTAAATHNVYLMRSLLVASIEALRADYGLSPSPAYDAFIAGNPDLLPQWTDQ